LIFNLNKNTCTKSNSNEPDNGLPGWGIALIVIGCVLVAIVIGFFGFKYYRRKSSQRLLTTNEYKGAYTNMKGDSSL